MAIYGRNQLLLKSSLFLFLYFRRVRRGSCFDVFSLDRFRNRSSDSYYRNCARASEGFRETDKSLDDFSPSPRSGCAADKARRTRHRLVSPSSHFSIVFLLVTSLYDDNTLLANYFAVTARDTRVTRKGVWHSTRIAH